MSGYFAGLVLKLLLWQLLTTLDAIPTKHFGRCKFNQNISGFCRILDDCNSLTLSQMSDEAFLDRHKCGSAYNNRLVCCPNELFDSTFSSSKIDLPLSPHCGHMLKDRIFRGNRTGPGEYPWMTLIETTRDTGEKSFVCGGALINDRWVLTAAHCHNGIDGKITAVRLGEWNTATDVDCIVNQNNIRECLPPHVDVNVDEVVQHNLYRRFENENDIALVRMSRAISTTQFIKPICLPVETRMRTDMFENSDANIAGWGRTEMANKVSEWKLEANLTIWERDLCEVTLETFKTTLDDRRLCAGSTVGQSSCAGDSGGPLMLERKAFFAIGVISSGVRGCSGAKGPIVFTRVGPFMDWIQDTINGY